MTDRPVELDDIQGNILGGFNTDFQRLVALTAVEPKDFARSAQWLALLAPAVTVVSEVQAARSMMKAAAREAGTWLSVAVGQRLLAATQPDVTIRDVAFKWGMRNRAASILADKTDQSRWRVGGTDKPVDVLLIIAANDEGAVVDRADALIASAAQAGLKATYQETGRRLDDREHFGFKDGISQPKVFGFDTNGELGAGYFVFGYPQEPGADPFWPVVDPRRVTDNGSLLVFRRLEQNVDEFRRFCSEESMRLSPQWPGLTAPHLAAMLVGRWPSGAPVRASQTKDPGARLPAMASTLRMTRMGSRAHSGHI